MIELINEKYKDESILSLNIYATIGKANTLIAATPIDYENYNNTLADLYIMLTVYMDSRQELINDRVKKILKIDKPKLRSSY